MKIFLTFRQMSECAKCLMSCLWTPLNKAWILHLCTLPSIIYIHSWDPLYTFSSPGWAVLALSAFPCRRDGPVISVALHWTFQYVHHCLALRSSELDPALQVWSFRWWVEGKDPLPPHTAMLLPMQPRIPLAFTAAHCWLMSNFMFTGTFSAKLLSIWPAPNIYWCIRWFLLRCRT